MKKILLLIFILSITGCSTPIAYNCPKISLPKQPALEISKLTKNSTPPEVMKAYVASVVSLKKWGEAVESQISIN